MNVLAVAIYIIVNESYDHNKLFISLLNNLSVCALFTCGIATHVNMSLLASYVCLICQINAIRSQRSMAT